MEQSKKLEIFVGALLALTMVCVFFALYAGNQVPQYLGPRSLLQAANGDIWIYQDKELLIASAHGELKRRVDLAPLALPGPVNSMVSLPDEDGQPRVLLAAIKSPDWLVMDGDGQVVRRLKPSGIDVPVGDTFHLAAADTGRIAMGTAGDHRVLLFDRDGRFLAQSLPGLFRYANGLWFEAGNWRVTDTNHGRICVLDGESLALSASIHVPTVGAARFPALGRQGGDPGHMIVGTMFNDMERGRVIEVSGEGRLVREFPSRAEDPKPTDFLWLKDGLLLAERDNFSLQLFDRDGHYLNDWGDSQIGAVLAGALENRLHWQRMLRLAQGGAILFGVIAIIGYLVIQRRGASGTVAPSDTRFSRLATPCVPPAQQLGLLVEFIWLPVLAMLLLWALMWFGLPAIMPLVGLDRSPGCLSSGQLAILVAIMSAPLVAVLFLMNSYSARRSSEPRFEALLTSRWVEWLKRSKVAMSEIAEDEKVLEVVPLVTSRLFPMFNLQVWVLTSRRLLVLGETTLGGGKLLDILPRAGLLARLVPPSGRFAWFGGRQRIVLGRPGRRELSGYASSPVTARRLVDLVRLKTAVQSSGQRESVPVERESRQLRPGTAFLMSLVVPGAAQFAQGRFSLGLVLLTGMLIMVAAMVVPVLLGWIGHFYDVPLSVGVPSLLIPLVWAFLAGRDAYDHARRQVC